MKIKNQLDGLFWTDQPKEKQKSVPPTPVWLEPGYLPEVELRPIDMMTDEELLTLSDRRLVFDIECYINYFLISFMSVSTGKVICFEKHIGVRPNVKKLEWIISNYQLIGFNSRSYDAPMLDYFLAGADNEDLKHLSDKIISESLSSFMTYRILKLKDSKIKDHIDLIEVAPLKASLKIYGGRINTLYMQDLPFTPATELDENQKNYTKHYCVNDLLNTLDLYNKLLPAIELRQNMSNEYGIDLRSKSDAQIAEHVIKSELGKIINDRIEKPIISEGTTYTYDIPECLSFKTTYMKHILKGIRRCLFVVNDKGSIETPGYISQLQVTINKTSYTVGIGGLHSCEKSVYHESNEYTELIDVDAASFYPYIILTQELAPGHLGKPFLDVYKKIVDKRLKAKKEGNKLIADSLKITINGSFGKLGSKHSIFYSPKLLIQVTLSGQLFLLMLIETFELNNIPVLSANTDGIICSVHASKKPLFKKIVKEWEQKTKMVMEETYYCGVYSRDVNNYIAIKTDGSIKLKGAYAEPNLSKNLKNTICIEAALEFIKNKTPIERTVTNCTDITKFITLLKVTGGAVKDGKFIGKAVRWYYGSNEEGVIVYANSGNKVPRSEGAVPHMDLTKPVTDINHQWYINESKEILKELGVSDYV